jgi:CubicO group peptidase (beta-lactamase class C family)
MSATQVNRDLRYHRYVRLCFRYACSIENVGMTPVDRRLAGLVAAIALIAHASLPSGAGSDRVASPSVQDIQQSLRFVPARMAYYHVPGLSLACIHDGTVEWTQGFGTARVGGELVTPETLFQASSISMPVTAVAVLRLVDQGKLDLDVDMTQYLRSWKLPTNRFTEQKKVTLRQLLSHTAGVAFAGYAGYPAGEKLPTLSRSLMVRVRQTLHG